MLSFQSPFAENKIWITVKPLNSGHLRDLKNLAVIERCPLLGGNLKKIDKFGTKRFVRYSWHVRYLGCPLLGGFTVFVKLHASNKKLIITKSAEN